MKIGRNAPCPCGSGKKYKKCHEGYWNSILSGEKLRFSEKELKKKMDELEGLRIQREKQQGLGRPIISTTHNGYRLVAVGKKLYWSDKWKTFHDFLIEYIKDVFGREWGDAEICKPFDERHPLLQWYDQLCRYQKENIKEPGKVHFTPIIGAVAAYLNLAYNLYLLAHNIDIQSRLIERLKNNNQFFGAYYETYVAATFIKAGFDLHFEDEGDISSSHCEFTAISKNTGNKYSVEAKSREPNKDSVKIGNQLYNALKKKANYKRIVFIDINVPDTTDKFKDNLWINSVLEELSAKETCMTIKGAPAPEAYVFVTNYPYCYSLESTNFRPSALVEGYKIPEFKTDSQFENLSDALKARKKHTDMEHLLLSMREHHEIPTTFDGDIPELAYGNQIPRLKIGQKYFLPTEDGKEVIGELTTATVSEYEKIAYCAYQLENGKSVIYSCPLDDEEWLAYKRHPDTFFGIYLPQGKKTEHPFDLFDFFFESYKNSPKEKLLEFMKAHPDYENLILLSHEELVQTYCERLVNSVLNLPEVTTGTKRMKK